VYEIKCNIIERLPQTKCYVSMVFDCLHNAFLENQIEE